MSVYKPKNSSIWYYDFQHRGQRYYGSTGQKMKEAANRVEQKIRAEAVLETRKGKKPLITLDQAAAIYEDKLTAEGKWNNNEEGWVTGLIDAIGASRYLSDIRPHELSAFAAVRAGQVAASSVNREIDVWRSLWRKVHRTHDVGEMPDWGSMKYAVQEHHPPELTPEQDDILLGSLREDLADFFEFLLASGWRVTEVRTLLWSNVDFHNQVARITSKGRDEIKCPLSSRMIAIIARQPKACPQVFTYICQQSRMKRRKGERYPFSRDGWRKEWNKALTIAGIDNFRVHDLRHTRGNRVQRASGNLRVTQGALHHKDVKSTLRYIHASQDDVLAGLEASESRTIPEVKTSEQRKSNQLK